MELENITTEEEKKLTISAEGVDYLTTVAKWIKFFAILGIVFLAIFVIAAFIVGALIGKNSGTPFLGAGMSFMYIIMGAIYVYPIITSLKFHNFTKLAIENTNDDDLTNALKNLRETFQYIGILTIIVLALYVIMILLMLLFGVFANDFMF